MGAIQILLPPDLQAVVDAEVAAGGFADGAAFVESLVRQRQRQRDELVALLAEAEADGLSARSFDEIIAEARERYRSAAA